MRTTAVGFALAVWGVLACPRIASAQTQDALVRATVHDALDAYQSLDVDGAIQRLQDGLRRCGRRGCSPRVVAEVNVAMGVVAAGGRNDTTAAERAFTAAFAADPTVTLDATQSTPEIAALFAHARRALRTAPVQRLPHTPVTEQLVRTPIPVYVENSATPPVRADVFYRATGTQAWRSADLPALARGFGGEIPCVAVIAPAGVDYYVWGYDEHDVPFAEVGTDDAPFHVNVVDVRSQPAPSLPGALPPAQCAGATASGAPEPAACTDDVGCTTGQTCREGHCVAAPAPPPVAAAPHGQLPMLNVEVGVGLGFGVLSGATAYDEAVRANPTDPNSARCVAVSCPVGPTGVFVTPYLWFAGRYNLTRRIGIAGSVRWQPDSGSRTTLSSVLLSVRGYYAFWGEGFTTQGFTLAGLAGTGIGQIQVRPPQPSAAMPGAPTGHLITGLNNLHFGARAEYAFQQYVHVGAELVFQFELGQFLFDIDLQAVAGVHF